MIESEPTLRVVTAEESDKALLIGVGIGAGVGGLLLLAVVITLTLMCCMRGRSPRANQKVHSDRPDWDLTARSRNLRVYRSEA